MTSKTIRMFKCRRCCNALSLACEAEGYTMGLHTKNSRAQMGSSTPVFDDQPWHSLELIDIVGHYHVAF